MSLLVNNRAYGWADATVKFPFGDVEIESIDYDDELEKEVQYGRGNMPRGVGIGNYKANCKLTFKLDYWEEVERYYKAQGISIYNLDVPKIIVSHDSGGGLTRTDEITKVGFTKVSHKTAQGDKNATVDVECVVSGMIIRDGVKPINSR